MEKQKKSHKKISNLISKTKKVAVKTTITFNVLLCTLSTTMMSASAANNAPSGVDTTSYNLVVDIVMWIVIAAIGASAVPGLQSIVKGQTDNDVRERNSGIVSVIVAGCCICAAAVLRTLCF